YRRRSPHVTPPGRHRMRPLEAQATSYEDAAWRCPLVREPESIRSRPRKRFWRVGATHRGTDPPVRVCNPQYRTAGMRRDPRPTAFDMRLAARGPATNPRPVLHTLRASA